MLAVAISCIAWVWYGSGLDHVARVSGHACREIVFRTCVVHVMMMLVRTITWHVWVCPDVRWHDTQTHHCIETFYNGSACIEFYIFCWRYYVLVKYAHSNVLKLCSSVIILRSGGLRKMLNENCHCNSPVMIFQQNLSRFYLLPAVSVWLHPTQVFRCPRITDGTAGIWSRHQLGPARYVLPRSKVWPEPALGKSLRSYSQYL